MSKVQLISVISFLSYSAIIGALVFSRGFLLNRKVLQDKAGPCVKEKGHSFSEPGGGGTLSLSAEWCNSEPPFTKAVFILVDALRYDFVQRMKFLSGVLQGQEKDPSSSSSSSLSFEGTKACLFKFVADPPTTTMQRLKALMTGTMPTFIDASANFNSYEVEEDSLIYQLWSSGKSLAFLGDDTWLSLFPRGYFTSPLVEAFPSFNAWDLDTVDKAVNLTLRQKVFQKRGGGDGGTSSDGPPPKWDVLICHLLGVDHCGHRYGPSHPEMKRKLREADEIIQFVFESMSESTLLVVFGDHGMTSTGDHGGDSELETDSAVVFISKEKKSKIGAKRGSGGPKGSAFGGGPFQCPSYTKGISQIDLVPTLATLLGVPIPFSSIGQVVPNFLPNSRSFYSRALSSNVLQVERFLQKSGLSLSPSLQGDFKDLQDLQKELERVQTSPNSSATSKDDSSSGGGADTGALRAKLTTLSHLYLSRVKSEAGQAWTQFNVPMIWLGVCITGGALVALAIYLQIFTKLQKRRKSLSQGPSQDGSSSVEGPLYPVLSWLWPSLPLWSVLWSFKGPPSSSSGPSTYSTSSNLYALIISTFAGLFMFLVGMGLQLLRLQNNKKAPSTSTTSISSKSSKRLGFKRALDLWALLIYSLTCLSVFSNSFVINEGPLLGSTLILVVFLQIVFNDPPSGGPGPFEEDLQLVQRPLRRKCQCQWSCFLLLALLLRTSQGFFRCREELQQCEEPYLLHKHLQSLPETPDWILTKYLRYSFALVSLSIFVVSFRLWMLHKKCLFSKGVASLVAKFVPILLVIILGVFWALSGLPFISGSSKLRPFLNYFPWLFQAISITALVVTFWRPLFHLEELLLHPPPLPAKKIFKNGLQTKSNYNGFKTKAPQILLDLERQSQLPELEAPHFSTSDQFTSPLMLLTTLVVVLMAQITSVGMAPSVSLIIPNVIISLIGIFRGDGEERETLKWTPVVAFTLASQTLFYGTGHQPIFSAIPWDSAFLSGADGQSFQEAQGAVITWLRPCLAILGNLHVSQIVFSLGLPLLVYWGGGNGGRKSLKKAFSLSGKFLALHGFKLLASMACAGWHRRHLMVWKIFAPKFIFELVSFIVTFCAVMGSLVFVARVDYLWRKKRHKLGINEREGKRIN